MELKYYLRGLGLGIAVTAIIMGIAASRNKTMTNEEIIARAKELGMIEDTVLTAGDSDAEDDKQSQESEPSGEEDTKSEQGELQNTQPSDTQPSDAQSPASDADASGDNLQGNADAGTDTANRETETDADDNSVESSLDLNAGESDTQTGARTTDSGVDAEAGDSEDSESENGESGEYVAIPSGPMVITIGRGDGSYSASKKLADVGAVSSASEFDTFLCQNGYDKKIRAGTYTIPADASEEQMARIITGVE